MSTVLTGGVSAIRHRGQDMPSTELVLVLPSSLSTTFCMPTLEQITNSSCGWSTGDATATPSVSTNHSRANLASQGDERRECNSGMRVLLHCNLDFFGHRLSLHLAELFRTVTIRMPQLLHEGLLLRPFEDGDAPAFATAARESVATVGRWMPWCHAGYTQQDALDWFAVCRSGAIAGTAYEFGIFDEQTSEFLGGAGLNQINLQHAFCNLGYWVRQSKHRQGVASRCVRALAEHAFKGLGLKRVEIVVAIGNQPSFGVAQNSGAMLECVARNRLLIHGNSVAASVFSLIPE